jgi:hypothetical protein
MSLLDSFSTPTQPSTPQLHPLLSPPSMQIDFLTPYTHLLLDKNAISATASIGILQDILTDDAHTFVSKDMTTTTTTTTTTTNNSHKDTYCRRIHVRNPAEPRDGSYARCTVGIVETHVSSDQACWAVDLQRRSNTHVGGECAYVHHLFHIICQRFAPFVFGAEPQPQHVQTHSVALPHILLPVPFTLLPHVDTEEKCAHFAQSTSHLARMALHNDGCMIQALLALCRMSTCTCPRQRSLLRMLLGVKECINSSNSNSSSSISNNTTDTLPILSSASTCDLFAQAHHDSHHLLKYFIDKEHTTGAEARRLSQQIHDNLATSC